MELKDSPGESGLPSRTPGTHGRVGPLYALGTREDLVGRRVQIRAVKAYGSAHLLNGLTGTVVEIHPIASGWVKIELDPNSRTPHRDWSVAADRLVLLEPEFPQGGLIPAD